MIFAVSAAILETDCNQAGAFGHKKIIRQKKWKQLKPLHFYISITKFM